MTILEFLNANSNAITALAAVVAAAVAVSGVQEWKKQTRGKSRYEIARQCLKCALIVRERIKQIRNPFIPAQEIKAALEEHGLESSEYSDRRKTNRSVYNSRWKKVSEAKTDLDAVLIEAEVLWGTEVNTVAEPLDECIQELYSAIFLYLEEASSEEEESIVYGNRYRDDEFSTKVNNAIKRIEKFLKPYLLRD